MQNKGVVENRTKRTYRISIEHDGQKAVFAAGFSDKGLVEISWSETDKDTDLPELLEQEGPQGKGVRKFLEAFGAEKFKEAEAVAKDIPIDPQGTPFQKAVWLEIKKIPAGQVLSYGEIARRIGKPKAVRAVGNACGANPLSPLIPCHRVIASGNKLGGFSGDLNLKRELLKREGASTLEQAT